MNSPAAQAAGFFIVLLNGDSNPRDVQSTWFDKERQATQHESRSDERVKPATPPSPPVTRKASCKHMGLFLFGYLVKNRKTSDRSGSAKYPVAEIIFSAFVIV
jgi:hypothetical protein